MFRRLNQIIAMSHEYLFFPKLILTNNQAGMCKAGCRLLCTVPRLPVLEKSIETILLGLYDVGDDFHS